MAPDLVNKFQINCLRGSSVIERKTNYEMEGHIDLPGHLYPYGLNLVQKL
jgi:hypothetical protein